MFDSAPNIGDDVLQRELSHSADDRMRTIVATMVREQNAVIRNETADVLILQGVAGSGKTSIALHRVAFLLYRFKDTLSSDNVMILSPNKVFGDYIADVLPELGEEQVAEIDFDRIAGRSPWVGDRAPDVIGAARRTARRGGRGCPSRRATADRLAGGEVPECDTPWRPAQV